MTRSEKIKCRLFFVFMIIGSSLIGFCSEISHFLMSQEDKELAGNLLFLGALIVACFLTQFCDNSRLYKTGDLLVLGIGFSMFQYMRTSTHSTYWLFGREVLAKRGKYTYYFGNYK